MDAFASTENSNQFDEMEMEIFYVLLHWFKLESISNRKFSFLFSVGCIKLISMFIRRCRFCRVSLIDSNTAPEDPNIETGLHNAVCNSTECLEKRKWSCSLKHKCGHACIGLLSYKCIPCSNSRCANNGGLNNEDYCHICQVNPLYSSPCVHLECDHYFHFMCLWQQIDRKWPAAHITFNFLKCVLCKKDIKHEAFSDLTKRFYDLKAEIRNDAVQRAKLEGIANDKRLSDPTSVYYEDLGKFAMDRLLFFPCYKCKQPYYGGMQAADNAELEQEEQYKQEHLVCGSCSRSNIRSCKMHGRKYMTYKCKFCCNVASRYCWGSTHFCKSCHAKQMKGDYLNRKPISELPKCPGKDNCVLGIEHPPNGTHEFCLGCVVCWKK